MNRWIKDTEGAYWRADQFWMLTISEDDNTVGGVLPDGSFVVFSQHDSRAQARQSLGSLIHEVSG